MTLVLSHLVFSVKYGKSDVEQARSGCLKLPPKQSYVVSMQCPNDEDKNSCISTTFLHFYKSSSSG